MVAAVAKLGPVVQIAYVRVDFDAALRCWTEVMGVGPFSIREPVEDETSKYRAIATSYWGKMQIESIRRNDQSPSIFHYRGRPLHEGIHHFRIRTRHIAGASQSMCRGTIVQERRSPVGIESSMPIPARQMAP